MPDLGFQGLGFEFQGLNGLGDAFRDCIGFIWGFPKIRCTFLGVPVIRTIVFWGLYWGPPILGNYHIFGCLPAIGNSQPFGFTENFWTCGAQVLVGGSGGLGFTYLANKRTLSFLGFLFVSL